MGERKFTVEERNFHLEAQIANLEALPSARLTRAEERERQRVLRVCKAALSSNSKTTKTNAVLAVNLFAAMADLGWVE
jgi:hypothetical protein